MQLLNTAALVISEALCKVANPDARAWRDDSKAKAARIAALEREVETLRPERETEREIEWRRMRRRNPFACG